MGSVTGFNERWILRIQPVADFDRSPPAKARRQTSGKPAISISELSGLVNADVFWLPDIGCWILDKRSLP